VLHLVVYFLCRALLAAFQAIAYPTSLRLARRVGRLVYRLDGKHRRRTLEHLRLALGERPDLDRLARQVFETMALHAAEFMQLPRRGFTPLPLENAEILERARDTGRGVVIVSAHLGPFGLLALLARSHGIRAAVVLKRQKNLRLLNWAIGQLDRHFGVDVLLKHDARERGPDVLQAGHALVLFADQHPIAGGIPTEFFGLPIEAAAGPTVFARRLGCPLVVLTAVFGPDGVPRFRADGPVSLDGTPEEVSGRWISILEDRIREHPGQWMWMHRRWRDLPAREPAAARR
jgi:KDO2-lipid IV(A) lauroyltransferase